MINEDEEIMYEIESDESIKEYIPPSPVQEVVIADEVIIEDPPKEVIQQPAPPIPENHKPNSYCAIFAKNRIPQLCKITQQMSDAELDKFEKRQEMFHLAEVVCEGSVKHWNQFLPNIANQNQFFDAAITLNRPREPQSHPVVKKKKIQDEPPIEITQQKIRFSTTSVMNQPSRKPVILPIEQQPFTPPFATHNSVPPVFCKPHLSKEEAASQSQQFKYLGFQGEHVPDALKNDLLKFEGKLEKRSISIKPIQAQTVTQIYGKLERIKEQVKIKNCQEAIPHLEILDEFLSKMDPNEIVSGDLSILLNQLEEKMEGLELKGESQQSLQSSQPNVCLDQDQLPMASTQITDKSIEPQVFQHDSIVPPTSYNELAKQKSEPKLKVQKSSLMGIKMKKYIEIDED